MVRKGFACHSVDPEQGVVAGGDDVDASPDDQEGLGKDIESRFCVGSTPEISVDRLR